MLPRFISGLPGAIASVALAAGLAVPAAAQQGAAVAEQAFARDSTWGASYSMGRDIYEENCSACHGEHGMGGYGLPLNLQSFLTIANTDYLLRTMEYGRPIRGMPSFAEDLSLEERKAVAYYIKSWQYRPNLKLPANDISGDAENGHDLYMGICAGCHGLDGEGGPNVGGGHVIGAVSGIGGPALADPGFLKSASNSYIKATLMYGRVGTPMGAYLKGRQGFVELLESEIDDIVIYLRSLEPEE